MHGDDNVMNEAEAKARIEEHRARIDSLDEQILSLLNERAGESLAIRGLKPYAGMEHFDPAREQKIVERLEAVNEGPLHGEDIREIYATLLKVMKATRA